MFKTCGNKGFHITFPNGLVLSTQFGPGNYGDNYSKPFPFDGKTPDMRSHQVEVAVFMALGDKWMTMELFPDAPDDVLAYQTFDQWLAIFDKVRAWTPKQD